MTKCSAWAAGQRCAAPASAHAPLVLPASAPCTLAFIRCPLLPHLSALRRYGPSSPIIDRGIALHKMIRLVTMVLGGEQQL